VQVGQRSKCDVDNLADAESDVLLHGIGACSSPPTPAATTSTGRPLPAPGHHGTNTTATLTHGGVGDPQGRLLGNVCFAGSHYRAGSQYRRRQVQVAVVEISIGTELIRCYPVKHDRTREHGALANPGCRPRRSNAA
jgi:hypothetical protein